MRKGAVLGSEEVEREDRGSRTEQHAGWGRFKMRWMNKILVLIILTAMHFCWAALV